VKVYNRTKHLLLSGDAIFAGSFGERRRGLSGRGECSDLVLASSHDTLVGCVIHMVGMEYPIDVAWVDGKGVVVGVRRRVPAFSLLRPSTWRFYWPNRPARYVVELGKGGLGTTEVGDEIELKKD